MSSSKFEALIHLEWPRNMDFHHEKGHFGGGRRNPVAGPPPAAARWPDHRHRQRVAVAGRRCSRSMGLGSLDPWARILGSLRKDPWCLGLGSLGKDPWARIFD